MGSYLGQVGLFVDKIVSNVWWSGGCYDELVFDV